MTLPKLVVMAGPRLGSVSEISEDQFFIGRGSSCHLELFDLAASRIHARIQRRGNELMLTDLESANGTRINGMPALEAILHDGDEIAIGDTVLRFVATGEYDLAEVPFIPQDISAKDTILVPTVKCDPNTADDAEKSLRALVDLCAAILPRVGDASSLREALNMERSLIDIGMELTGASRGMFLRTSSHLSDGLACAVSRDESGWRSTPFAVSRTVIGEATRTGSAVLVPDLTQRGWPSAKSLAGVAGSLMALPLTEGILYLDCGRAIPGFNKRQVEVLQAAGAIFALAASGLRNIEHLESENLRLRRENQFSHSMVGNGARMREVYTKLAKVAASETTLLILGESGTGKEVAARAIHQNGSRQTRPFVAVNCALLSDALLESDLFGHERGAFTGAVVQKRGKLELAEGGTLFLDELGELPLAVQSKLLRVIQEREFERLGGTRTLTANIRVVAATNKNLEEAVQSGTFREDLYYRLKVISITLPPLRDRLEDIVPLVHYLITRCAARVGRRVGSIDPEVLKVFHSYSWPGNIRELENVLEYALVMGEGSVLRMIDLPDHLLECGVASDSTAATYHLELNRAKERLVRQALEAVDWNYTQAAANLRVNRTYLHRLVRNLRIGPA